MFYAAPSMNSTATTTAPPAAPPAAPPPGLLSIEALRVTVWPDERQRPSLRWLRTLQARRAIPYIKIGRRVFFEAERVRAALRKFEISAA